MYLPLLCLSLAARTLAEGPPQEAELKGRVLEACSCRVPCPCNFGQSPSPHDFCDSLAFFGILSGQLGGVSLVGSRFAIAGRAGDRAVVYLDSRMPAGQRAAAKRIATWVVSLEGTRAVSFLSGPINIAFAGRPEGSVAGQEVRLIASRLKGNDGKSDIVVSNPWMFGLLPIKSTRKCIAERVMVRTPTVSFDYADTNANDAVFEFPESLVR